jgi:nitrogen fixation/metabolism regulation signal transduction histidine kinase
VSEPAVPGLPAATAAARQRSRRLRPSLAGRWTVYLLVVHLGLGALVLLLAADRPWWFLGLELALVASLLAGLALARRSTLPRELLRTGAELIREEDLASRLSPPRDPEAAEVVALFNHLMERLRQERLAVEERGQLLGEVVAASPAAFLTLDHDGRIDLANRAAEALLDAPAAALVGRPVAALAHPVARELVALEDGQTRLLNLQGRRLRATRRRFYDRGFARSFFVVEELTEELRASERAAYDKLIRLISHEVKNSVGAVVSLLASTAAMARQLPAGRGEKAARGLAVAEDRLRNLDRFVNGFADVVRLPAPVLAPVDAGRLLDDLVVLLEPELAARRIAVAWRRDEARCTVLADENQLEQVLVNVFRNAIEAIGTDGRLDLSLARGERTVVLAVADSGPGIAPEVRDQLFVPFFSTKPDGRGLGLTLVREILDSHGASYRLDSRAEGGAELRMELPAVR